MSGELLSVLNYYLAVFLNAFGSSALYGLVLLIFIMGIIFMLSRSFEVTFIAGSLGIWVLYMGGLLSGTWVLVMVILTAIIITTTLIRTTT